MLFFNARALKALVQANPVRKSYKSIKNLTRVSLQDSVVHSCKERTICLTCVFVLAPCKILARFMQNAR